MTCSYMCKEKLRIFLMIALVIHLEAVMSVLVLPKSLDRHVDQHLNKNPTARQRLQSVTSHGKDGDKQILLVIISSVCPH